MIKPKQHVRYNCPHKSSDIIDGLYCLKECQIYANKNCSKWKRDKK